MSYYADANLDTFTRLNLGAKAEQTLGLSRTWTCYRFEHSLVSRSISEASLAKRRISDDGERLCSGVH
ncbi:hypothetical protein PILCRDRAFT_814387 [Piloderma croceum F 1598]|uniref:Uncharacterized protein n=1 Tax=Piloderma croceum (strain F 1598) TaxID=765440 RepID=A0A0C3G9S7_PILCF|nr:hypothetical protein PILCRDRAFT_814387 [Piloderma croceum F 1598]